MILLEVDKYCQTCPEFEADIETNTTHDFFGNVIVGDTKIYCKNRDICHNIRKHLEEQKNV